MQEREDCGFWEKAGELEEGFVYWCPQAKEPRLRDKEQQKEMPAGCKLERDEGRGAVEKLIC